MLARLPVLRSGGWLAGLILPMVAAVVLTSAVIAFTASATAMGAVHGYDAPGTLSFPTAASTFTGTTPNSTLSPARTAAGTAVVAHRGSTSATRRTVVAAEAGVPARLA
jgi:hypothetical protein